MQFRQYKSGDANVKNWKELERRGGLKPLPYKLLFFLRRPSVDVMFKDVYIFIYKNDKHIEIEEMMPRTPVTYIGPAFLT